MPSRSPSILSSPPPYLTPSTMPRFTTPALDCHCSCFLLLFSRLPLRSPLHRNSLSTSKMHSAQFNSIALPMNSPRLSYPLYNGPSLESFWSGPTNCGEKLSLAVVGHRGSGMNKTLPTGIAPDHRQSVKENTITSFNLAARNGADFVEFDVQVTQDGHAIIFHDDLIIAEEEGQTVSKHIGELTLQEFLSIGPQQDETKVGKKMARKAVDGSIVDWIVSIDDSLCTLKDVFQQVSPTIGFNIEVKFDDTEPVTEKELIRSIDTILQEVGSYAMGRKLYFSSFHPDAVRLLRQGQSIYPVFFLTEGGVHLYKDPRRNSIEAAIDVCLNSGLQGIVSEVKAVLQNPTSVSLAKEANLSLLTYGELNNMPEAVCKQVELGVTGVIVDQVLDIVTVIRNINQPATVPASHPATNVVLRAAA